MHVNVNVNTDSGSEMQMHVLDQISTSQGYYPSMLEACLDRGRIEIFECSLKEDEVDGVHDNIPGGVVNNNGTSSSANTPQLTLPVFAQYYKPCKLTSGDESFRLFEMQVVLVIVGVYAVRSVKQQKELNLSLFDQRRKRAGNNDISNGNGSASKPRGDANRYREGDASEVEMLIRNDVSQHSVSSRGNNNTSRSNSAHGLVSPV